MKIILGRDLQRPVREKVSDLGIALATHIRHLVRGDPRATQRSVDSSVIFDLGNSGGSDIAREKDQIVGEAASSRYRRY